MPDDDPDDDRAERDCEALAEEVARLEEANAFLLRQLETIDRTLSVPAAEYVPAIRDAFDLIDAALHRKAWRHVE